MGYWGARAATKDTASAAYWFLRIMLPLLMVTLALMALATVGVLWAVARLAVLAYWKLYRREPVPFSSWSFTAVWDRLWNGDTGRSEASYRARAPRQRAQHSRSGPQAPQSAATVAPAVPFTPAAASGTHNVVTTPSALASPTRVAELALPPEEAWRRLLSAMESVGKVEQMSAASRMVVGKARYGLNPVRIKLAVVPGSHPGASNLEIESHGQDVWGVASRKVTERVLLAMG